MEALKASLAATPKREAEKASRRSEGVVKLRAGTSGFAFKEWKGSFYPRS